MIGSNELFCKPISKLSLRWEYKNLPVESEDLKEYFENSALSSYDWFQSESGIVTLFKDDTQYQIKNWNSRSITFQDINDSQNFQNPFFMYLAFNAPHDPRQAPKKFLNLYPIEKISIPVNYSPTHPYMYEIGNGPGLRDEALAPYPRSKYSVKKHIQEYYAIISHLDEQVGKIISHLENKKLLENTYIIFTSDHGLSVGQHGLLGKQSLYDHSIRVPMIISGPKIKANSLFNSDVYLQDIVPTTLDLANIPVPDEMDFKSFYKLLINGKKEKIHDAIYGTYGCCGNEYYDYQRMIRKDDYKLIFFPQNKRMEFMIL